MLTLASRKFFYRHPGQLLLALIGVAAGVAVLVGVALLRDVLIESLDAAAEELAGADSLRIQPPGGEPIDEALYARLARTRGAPELIPVLTVGVRHKGRRLEVLGLDPFSLESAGALGLDGFVAGGLLAEAGVAVTARTLRALDAELGDLIELGTGRAGRRVPIVAALADQAGLDDRLLMDIAQAQALFQRPGQLSYLLAPAAARDWLEARLPGNYMLVGGGERRESARRLTAGMRANLGAMSLLALATGLFVVFSVLSFLMVQRRRQFGILRAIGVTRGQLARKLILEAAGLAAFGGLVGLVAGTWLADRLLALVRRPVSELYRQIPLATVEPDWIVYGLAWMAGIAAACVVVWPVVREVMEVPPGRLVRNRQPDGAGTWKPLIAGAGLLSAGLALIAAVGGLHSGLVGLFLVLAGLVVLVSPCGFGLLALVRRGLPNGFVARALSLLTSGRNRLAPALSALTLAVALAAGMGMMILGFRTAVDAWVDRLLRADVYLSLTQAPVPPEMVESLAGLPGIAHVSSVRQRILADGLRLAAYDLPAPAWAGFEWLDGDGAAARAAFLDGDGVLISEPLARRRNLAPGDRLLLPAPNRNLDLEVVAVFRDYSTDQGFVAIAGGVYRSAWDDEFRDSLGIYRAENIGLDDLEARVRALFDDDPALNLTRPAAFRAQTLAVFDRTFRISWALAGLVGLIALVALTSALLALGLERGRDYATLRALGMPPADLARLVAVQTGSVAMIAALIAIPLALVIHYALIGVVQPRAFGWSVPMGVPPAGPLLVVVPLVVAAGAAAGLYPAWRIARRPPAAELRAD